MNREVLLKILEEEKEIEQELSNPDVLNNREKYKELSLRYKKIKKIADLVREYFDLVENIEVAESLINEGDFSVQKELDEYRKKKVEVEKRIKFLLLGSGEGGNAILEIRAGTGGEEAALFAGDLLRMYMKYAEKKGWKFQIVDATKSDLGGFHKVVVYIEGEDEVAREVDWQLSDPNAPEEARRGGHGTSEYYLVRDFIDSIVNDTKPPIDVVRGVDMTIPGLIAHEAAMKGNVWLDVPHFE